jgi:hypothetical protein
VATGKVKDIPQGQAFAIVRTRYVSTKDAYTVIARAMDLIRRTGRTVTTTDEPAEPEPVRDLLIDVQTVMDGTDKLRSASASTDCGRAGNPATAAGRRNSSPPPWSIAESRSTSAASTGSPANTSSSPTTSPPRSTPPSPRKATFPEPIAGEAPSPGQARALPSRLCSAQPLTCGKADNPDKADHHPPPRNGRFQRLGWVPSDCLVGDRPAAGSGSGERLNPRPAGNHVIRYCLPLLRESLVPRGPAVGERRPAHATGLLVSQHNQAGRE